MHPKHSIPGLGTLEPDEDDPDESVSEPVPIPLFDGKPMSVTVENDSGLGAAYPPEIVDAVRRFLSLAPADRQAASPRVFRNYQEYIGAVGDIGVDIARAADVWQHVQPRHAVVGRSNVWKGDRDIYVLVYCDCDWEIEHGLQLVYRHGVDLVRVSAQDGFAHGPTT